MMNCANYVAKAKAALGDEGMSDRELGEYIGRAQQTIAAAKAGKMSDAVAMAIGDLLFKHEQITHAGEVILVAHAERKTDKRIRSTLLDYAKGVDWRRRSLPPKRQKLLQVATP